MNKLLLIILLIGMASVGCQQSSGSPKPRAYPRVEYPERNYIKYDTPGCPFRFEYPDYAEINKKNESCWFDLYMPAFNARLHCSYLPMQKRSEFDDLIEDAFVIAKKINERANYMEETRILNAQNVGGLTLTWTGPAASPIHFFLSDTSHHFFKGALYFNSKVQTDSLDPIAKFILTDIDHMISTFEWK